MFLFKMSYLLRHMDQNMIENRILSRGEKEEKDKYVT